MPTPRFRTVGSTLQAYVAGSWVGVGGTGGGMSIHGNEWHGATYVTSTQTWGADKITSGTLDGDRLPVLSLTKRGGVPATGTPQGNFLKDDGTWAVAGGGTPSSTVTVGSVFGLTTNTGSSGDYSRGDHQHGTPVNPITDHESSYNHALLHANTLDHANTNDPTSGEKLALAGTSGTPGTGNEYVTDDDARNTNTRTPTSHNNDAHSETYITQSSVTTHAAVTSSVHNFDVSGNAPAQSHDNTKHSVAYATDSDFDTHVGLTTTAHGGILLFNGLAKITVGTNQPTTPSTGDLWVDTN